MNSANTLDKVFSLNPFEIRVLFEFGLMKNSGVNFSLNPFEIRVLFESRTGVLEAASLSQSL